MATGRRTTPGGRLRGNGALPVVAGLAAALTLSGAAVYTVEAMPCDNAGQYVRHANSTELIGGCVNGDQLPGAPTQDPDEPDSTSATTQLDNDRR